MFPESILNHQIVCSACVWIDRVQSAVSIINCKRLCTVTSFPPLWTEEDKRLSKSTRCGRATSPVAWRAKNNLQSKKNSQEKHPRRHSHRGLAVASITRVLARGFVILGFPFLPVFFHFCSYRRAPTGEQSLPYSRLHSSLSPSLLHPSKPPRLTSAHLLYAI